MHKLKVLRITQVTHNVKSFKLEKPENFTFIPGQATDLAFPENPDRKHPFTFASLNSDSYLEFVIKIYIERNGFTGQLNNIKEGDYLLMEDPWGAIHYENSGVFIAGGAGITPFIAILRQLRADKKLKNNTLIFSNKTEKDIILKSELDEMKTLGLSIIYTLTRENNPKYNTQRINSSFLKEKIKDFSQHFYICGPITFVGEIQHILKNLGANPDSIVLET